MSVLRIPGRGRSLRDHQQIQDFLSERGIRYERWEATRELSDSSTQEEILKAYEGPLGKIMEEGQYQTADVINVNNQTEGLLAIRQKFLSEHTHSEDEVRFFVDGQGLFWFNLENEDVFSVLCTQGTLISVPANTKHWFDLGPEANVKAIRIFTDQAGWVPHYTDSKIDEQYNPVYSS
jgi:1,2-dihydroxy-3-keto-5-methylthiopentene dioxygenase